MKALIRRPDGKWFTRNNNLPTWTDNRELAYVHDTPTEAECADGEVDVLLPPGPLRQMEKDGVLRHVAASTWAIDRLKGRGTDVVLRYNMDHDDYQWEVVEESRSDGNTALYHGSDVAHDDESDPDEDELADDVATWIIGAILENNA